MRGRSLTIVLVSCALLAALGFVLLNRGAVRRRAVAEFHPVGVASTTRVGRELLVVDNAPARYHPIRYEYVMPEDQQRRVLRGAPELRAGQTVEQVVERLGPPLRDRMLYPKESGRPGHRELSYYFATRELDGANSYDPCVAVFFDTRGRVESVASNVPAIPSLSWPASEGVDAGLWTPATAPSRPQ
jgi:hypothetical protein